jgi:O-antigen ligase
MLSRRATQSAPWLVAALALSFGLGILLASNAMIALDLAIAGIGGLAIVAQPELGLLALLGLDVRNPNSLFYFVLTIAAGLVALTVLRRGPVPRAVVWPFGLFLLVALPSVPLRPSFDEGYVPPQLVTPLINQRYSDALSGEMHRWLGVMAVFVVFLLVTQIVRDPRRLRLLLGGILVLALVPIGFALKQWAAGDLVVKSSSGPDFAAVRGTFDHPNAFGSFLVVVLAVALASFLDIRSVRARLGLAALIALGSVSLFLTYARGAWIGIAVVVLVLGIVRSRMLMLAGIVMILLTTLAFPGAVQKAQNRFGDVLGQNAGNNSSSWSWRTGQWDRMVDRGWDKPILGHGYGSYERQTVAEFGYLDKRYKVIDKTGGFSKPRGFSAHNDYVRTWVEMGVVGLGLWVATLLGLLATAVRLRRAPPARTAATAGVALMAALIVMQVADNIQASTLTLMLTAAVIAGAWGAATAVRSTDRSAARRPLDAGLGPRDRPQHVAPAQA